VTARCRTLVSPGLGAGKTREIYAIASHLVGNMVRDTWDCGARLVLTRFEWGESGGTEASLHSLGNLLSRQPAPVEGSRTGL